MFDIISGKFCENYFHEKKIIDQFPYVQYSVNLGMKILVILWLNACDDEIKIKAMQSSRNKKSFLCIFNKLNIAKKEEGMERKKLQCSNIMLHKKCIIKMRSLFLYEFIKLKLHFYILNIFSRRSFHFLAFAQKKFRFMAWKGNKRKFNNKT